MVGEPELTRKFREVAGLPTVQAFDNALEPPAPDHPQRRDPDQTVEQSLHRPRTGMHGIGEFFDAPEVLSVHQLTRLADESIGRILKNHWVNFQN